MSPEERRYHQRGTLRLRIHRDSTASPAEPVRARWESEPERRQPSRPDSCHSSEESKIRREKSPWHVYVMTPQPVSLELGGKSPIVAFGDVDLDKAAEWTIFGCFWTNGQICSATSRLIVHESIVAQFIEKLVQWSKNIKISDHLEEGCRLGPVVSGGQHLKKGFFLEPIIITDVTTSMEIWREGVFGPVLCIKTFGTEEAAIELANDTHYGLGAAVLSNDLERCERLTKAFQAGIVWINCSQPCFCQAPWGGNKRSGFGGELGEWGLDNYLSVKQVTQYISNEPWGWYKSPSKL